MKAAIFVLAGAVFALSSTGARAQESADSPVPQTWTPVPNCPIANAHGPQVYADVNDNDPNALHEVHLLIGALKACKDTPQAATPEQQSGEVIPDDGSSGSSDSGNEASIDDVLQTLENFVQAYPPAYAQPPARSLPSYAVPSAPLPSYAVPAAPLPSYAIPSYAVPSYAVPSYAVPPPAYARPNLYGPRVYINVRPAAALARQRLMMARAYARYRAARLQALRRRFQ
jgi:hypothetical protein